MIDRKFQRRSALIAMALGLALSFGAQSPAFAQQLSLDTARSQGLVGELPNGLLGATVNEPAVLQLVEQINIERLAAYQRISRSEQTPLSQVQSIAGQKIYENVPAGTLIRDQSGQWVRK